MIIPILNQNNSVDTRFQGSLTVQKKNTILELTVQSYYNTGILYRGTKLLRRASKPFQTIIQDVMNM